MRNHFIRAMVVMLFIALLFPLAVGATGQEEGARTKLTMFFTNAGLAYPPDLDPSDNMYINVIEEMANVDLEVTIPPYQEYATKFNLLLSSGDIPDLVFCMGDIGKLVKEATDKAGTFIDLKPYYDKGSAEMKKYITPTMMELAKSPGGKYPIFCEKGYDDRVSVGFGIHTRWDLVLKYNNGVMPKSVDEWIAFTKKVQVDIPDMYLSWPNNNCTGWAARFYILMNGINWWTQSTIDKNGKAVYAFVTPQYRNGIMQFRKAYAEGVVRPDFLTVASSVWTANQDKALMREGNSWWSSYVNKIIETNEQLKHMVNVPIPYWESPDIGGELGKLGASAYPPALTNSWGWAIPSTSKNPKKAFAVAAAFATDKVKDMVACGIEGVTYEVKDGAKVVNYDLLATPFHASRITFGYWTGTAGAIAKIAEEGYKNVSPEVAKLIRDEVKVMEALTWKLGVSPSQTRLAYKNTDADEVRSAEVSPFIMETITKVVVGKEDFAWFDQRVAEFQKKYGDLPQKSIDYYYTKRSELEKMGVIFFWEKY